MAGDTLSELIRRLGDRVEAARETAYELCNELVSKLSSVIPDITCEVYSPDVIYLDSPSRSGVEMYRKYGGDFIDKFIDLTVVLNSRYGDIVFMTTRGVFVSGEELKKIDRILGWEDGEDT